MIVFLDMLQLYNNMAPSGLFVLFIYAFTAQVYSDIRPIHITQIMCIHCELIHISCIHTETALTAIRLQAVHLQVVST